MLSFLGTILALALGGITYLAYHHRDHYRRMYPGIMWRMIQLSGTVVGLAAGALILGLETAPKLTPTDQSILWADIRRVGMLCFAIFVAVMLLYAFLQFIATLPEPVSHERQRPASSDDPPG